MSKHILLCKTCHKEITDTDFIVTTDFLSIAPLCPSCYSSQDKSFVGSIFLGTPINGSAHMVQLIFLSLITIGIIFFYNTTSVFKNLGFVVLLFLIVTIINWAVRYHVFKKYDC